MVAQWEWRRDSANGCRRVLGGFWPRPVWLSRPARRRFCDGWWDGSSGSVKRRSRESLIGTEGFQREAGFAPRGGFHRPGGSLPVAGRPEEDEAGLPSPRRSG